MAQCDKLPLDVVFGSSGSAPVQQLLGLVDKVSYLGACDLLLLPEEVSILSTTTSPALGSDSASLEPSIAGALLERQLDGLEPSRWKDGVREIFIMLLQDALRVYSEAMPVRRARVLIRCMDFVYRDQTQAACAMLGFEDVEAMSQQVVELAMLQVSLLRSTWRRMCPDCGSIVPRQGLAPRPFYSPVPMYGPPLGGTPRPAPRRYEPDVHSGPADGARLSADERAAHARISLDDAEGYAEGAQPKGGREGDVAEDRAGREDRVAARYANHAPAHAGSAEEGPACEDAGESKGERGPCDAKGAGANG